MTQITANGIRLEVERYGAADAAAMLLVRGLGTQLIDWPPALIERLTDAGFQVVVFDNRDAGLSQKFHHAPVPDLSTISRRRADAPPYGLEDMAADGIGVLDALGIASAHIVGTSMGGMIVQLMAANYPERVLSMTSIMSTSGNPDIVMSDDSVRDLLNTSPDDAADLESVISHTLLGDEAWGSPAYPHDLQQRRASIAAAFTRCSYPDGVGRQLAAIYAAPSRVDLLKTIKTPSLVIHGTDDNLVRIECGRDTARHIPKCRFISIKGMGHDLAGELAEIVADHLVYHVRRYASRRV